MAGKTNTSKQIFISYSRVDMDFARALYAELAALGFTLWRDRAEIEGGENWWLQIEDAIRGVETMVLCLSEKALESPVVRKEWRTARQEGTRVIPVIASDVDFKKLPQWMTDVHWYDFRQKVSNPEHQLQWDRFVTQLKTPYEPKRVPFMVENLPEGFVPRPDVLEPMVAALLDDERENPKAITTAIRGAGGYGKTTMARAICHDERIQQAFDDGVLWVTLGETPDLITLVLDLVFALRGERPPVTGLDAAQAELAKALADRDVLLVIDDCWQLEHIKPFVQGGNRCARLITTRRRETLPENTQAPYELAEMKTAEATALLGFGLANAADQGNALITLAKRLYEYPLLLRLVNGTLRDLVGFGQGLAAAIRDVNEALDQQAGDDWDSAVTRTLNISLKQLDSDPSLRERFSQLAVFPEDIDIPLATIGKLWGTGALVTKNACIRFAKLSLLLDLNLERGTIRLHDVIRAYLRKGVDLAVLDHKLLDAYQITEWHTLPLDEPYLWDHLFAHLWGAGRTEELIRTALDLRYLANKTAARSTYAVEADLVMAEGIAPEDTTLRLLKRQYVNMAHILGRCKGQNEIASTLRDRLQHLELLRDSCDVLYSQLTTPRLESWHELPDLPHPALVRVLTGHEDVVTSAAYSPDGNRIITASWDTVRVWEASSGKLLLTLEGHGSGVNSAAYSPNGKHLVTASWDKTVRVWEASSGKLLLTLEGHGSGVKSAAYSPDGKHLVTVSGDIYGSEDTTVRVWESGSGKLLFTLEGHGNQVNSAAYSPDGQHLVTTSGDSFGSRDNLARVWEASSGKLLLTLEGHRDKVTSAAYSPDGKHLVTTSYDSTARVWESGSGKLLLTLEGHGSGVKSAAYSPDGQHLVTASMDNLARMWESGSGKLLLTLEGHRDEVTSAAYSPDSQHLVTASYDKTARVWEAGSDKQLLTLEGHRKSVNSAAYSPDGQHLVTASWDKTAQVWEASSGKLLFTLEGHRDKVTSAAYSPDGKHLVTASWDCTARVWEATSGKLLLTLTGHEGQVISAAYSPDGKYLVIVSGDIFGLRDRDKTARVWEADSGKLLLTLEGHGSSVTSAAYSPDVQHIVTASDDKTARVWEADSGKLLLTFQGHEHFVTSAAYSPDGQHLVTASWDKTARVWEADSGKLLLTLTGHEDMVRSATYSPDGQHIVSASDDSTARVWDAQTGQLICTYFVDGAMDSVAWHPDGKHIVAGGRKGLYWLRLVE